MIPWRLTFSGIRDYPPTLLDLSGEKDHVLITGPNGAGKSTITFCMGAVLYSSKVDVEGLKSRNLPADQTWKAKISLLFYNEGLMKIDAPKFIEFSIKIVQEPGQPMKKEFAIASGDAIDEWEEMVRYTSGDRFYNFSAYKRDLQYKYKVDPDLFYLIWYQQEVNQFAVMHPEERFRIFSEMHGIDKVQRDWEESMEKVKETEETLRVAETNVKLMKTELAMKKTALDRFLDNQKRLHDGGKLYIESLIKLEAYFKKEIARLEDLIAQIEDDIADARDDLTLKKGLRENMKEQLEASKREREQLEAQIGLAEETVANLVDKIEGIETRIDELDRELAEITVKKSRLSRTEEEVRAALMKLSYEEQETSDRLTRTEQQLTEQKTAWEEKVDQISSLKQKVASDEEEEKTHRERLERYKSSHAVQAEIDSLEERVAKNKQEQFDLTVKRQALADELALLKENRDFSARQIESLQFFRSRGVKAYALRELIELDETARLKDERLFDAIKYTIFFNGREAAPPNDLYHVPLAMVVPDRVVTKLPALHLKVRDGLSDVDLPQAMKALWWVEQFFKENGYVIKNGILIDQVGIRGPQEKDRYILSEKALLLRKAEVEKALQEVDERLAQLKEDILGDTKTVQELNSIIHQVRESEAFMTSEHERVVRKKKLEEEMAAREAIAAEIKRLEWVKDELVRRQASQEQFRKILEEEAAIYEQLGKMKEKYEERYVLQTQLDEEKERLKKQKREIERLEEDLEQFDRKISKADREIGHLEEAIDAADRKIIRLDIDKKNRNDELETAKLELVNTINELEDLKKLLPDLYVEVAETAVVEPLPSLAKLKQSREDGKVVFDRARTETDIDPAAPENYETVKREYERLDNEYKRTSILLEQDKERMENLRDQLETTINMRVLELQQRFKSYMAQFQFEGDISWESYEDRSKRTHFHLYIKARKEGHRGSMEDVSTKARGGKVGKGVSGGEESLSSLLFALALLQNLQTTPGFIVLDEFDSALDEHRKAKVFDLYVEELKRKLIILTPKSHEETYLDRFSKAFIVQHDPTIPKSKVVGIVKTE
jgi:chromosome segregation ATPase